MSGHPLGDDSGVVSSALCPLCEAWAVMVDVGDVGWPLAGDLVVDALDEHLEEHIRRAGLARDIGRSPAGPAAGV